MSITHLLVSVLVLGAGLLAGPAMAQRNGDVRNGLDNQPTAGEVRSRERAADVAPSSQRQAEQTGKVDGIYRDLMGKENRDGMGAAPVNPAAPATTR